MQNKFYSMIGNITQFENFKNNNFIILFPSLLVFFSMITLPMLSISIDMWDGVSISFASDIGKNEGIFVYFMESNWLLQYPLSIIIIYLSKLIFISYKNLNAIFVLLFMFFFLYETLIFSKRVLKFDNLKLVFTTCLIATFPVWSVLLSSIMTFHLFCIALGFFSIRLIHSDSLKNRLIAIPFLIVSLNFQSLLVFLPILSLFYDFQNESRIGSNFFKIISYKTYLVFSVVFPVFLLLNVIYPPSGLYYNYNNSSSFLELGIKELVLNFSFYLTFFIPLFFIFIFNKIYFDVKNSKFILLILLSLAALFPYIVVGKSTAIWQVVDWNSRQGILLAFPFSIFIVYSLSFIKDFNFKYLLKMNMVLIIFFTIFFYHSLILLIGVSYKINRQIYIDKLTRILSEVQIPEGGLVQIIDRNQPKPILRVNESNYILYRAKNNPAYWTKLSSNFDPEFILPHYIKENSNYQLKYCFVNSNKHYNSHSIIYINSRGFVGVLNIFFNVFIDKDNSSIELNKVILL
uniref:hypothetical protein n=1 Tax=Algoriphagus sp. TaxID=1872435 RepID=UPI004048192E